MAWRSTRRFSTKAVVLISTQWKSTATGAAPASRYGEARMSKSRACNATSSASPMRPRRRRAPAAARTAVNPCSRGRRPAARGRAASAASARGGSCPWLRREEPKGVEVRALDLVRLDDPINRRLVDAER